MRKDVELLGFPLIDWLIKTLAKHFYNGADIPGSPERDVNVKSSSSPGDGAGADWIT